MALIDLRANPNEELLDRIAAPGGLYESAFPIEQERDDPAWWKKALWGEEHDGNPLVRALAIEGPVNGVPAIQGFVLTELYRRSRCGLISYLAVHPACRRGGLGRGLFEQACTALRHDAEQATGGPLCAVLAEIHDPDRTDPDADSMDPGERASFFAKLGARRLPIPYVQPELRPGVGPARTLDLVALPDATGDPVYNLPAAVVREFLEELYEGVEGDEADRDLAAMVDALGGGDVELEPLNLREERPVVSFETYGVAFHFTVQNDPPEPFPEPSEQFASFERDLLAYSYREQPPFSSRARHVDHAFRVVGLQPSRELRYVSEGETRSWYARGADRDGQTPQPVQVRASETRFRDGVVVYHLVLTPPVDARERAGDPSLTEYDLIRLIKLWEGGEDVTGPYEGEGPERCVRFWCRDDRPLTLRRLAASVFDDDRLLEEMPASGTVQLIVEDVSWDRVWEAAATLAETRRLDAHVQETHGPRLKAISGVVQGLADFEDVDEDELADVFRGVELEDGLHALHKGTLLTVGRADRAFDAVRRSVGISPYNLLPQAVLLHNEYQLRVAASAASRALPGRVRELERSRTEMQEALNRRWLPNVFHYEFERSLYKEGHDRRGLTFRNEDLQRRLTEVSARYETRVNRRRSVADDARNALLLGLGYTGARAAFPSAPDTVLASAFASLAVLYLAWRWDLAGLALKRYGLWRRRPS